jgi:small subunit ribosomal protein S20
MPIIKSAKKTLRKVAKRRVFNLRTKRALDADIKEITTVIGEGKRKEAEALFPKVQKMIDKAAKRGYIKQNTASRKKSRLVASIIKIAK